jgi:hypothetical protein
MRRGSVWAFNAAQLALLPATTRESGRKVFLKIPVTATRWPLLIVGSSDNRTSLDTEQRRPRARDQRGLGKRGSLPITSVGLATAAAELAGNAAERAVK